MTATRESGTDRNEILCMGGLNNMVFESVICNCPKGNLSPKERLPGGLFTEIEFGVGEMVLPVRRQALQRYTTTERAEGLMRSGN